MKILSFVTCEDIRLEVGGKSSLIGVFDGLILEKPVPAAGPPAVRIAAQLRFALEAGDPLPTEHDFRITVDDEVAASGAGAFIINRPERPVTVNVPMALIPVTKSCTIGFEYTFRAPDGTVFGPYRFDVPVQLLAEAGTTTTGT